MDRVVVCLDCQHYRKGGSCRMTGKDVGALQGACERAHEPMDDKSGSTPRPAKPAKPKVPEGHKYCSKCGEIKPIDAFGTKKSAKDGRQSWCKTCTNEAVRKAKKDKPKKEKESTKPEKKKTSKPKTKPMKKTETPAPVLNESIATMKTTTANPFSTFKDHELADELRARGYEVTATKTVTIQL